MPAPPREQLTELDALEMDKKTITGVDAVGEMLSVPVPVTALADWSFAPTLNAIWAVAGNGAEATRRAAANPEITIFLMA
jgi:hypothetical protein